MERALDDIEIGLTPGAPVGNEALSGSTSDPTPAGEHPFWVDLLVPYAKPSLRRSGADVLTSVVPYLALSVLMYASISVSPWLTLALAVPSAGFLLRTFIVFHDCTHGSFLPSKRANHWLGTALGLLVLAPFVRWRHDHAVHHATAGDLDRRGVGDVLTLTVAEYRARPWRARLAIGCCATRL
jgi:omega-6 fatty acid desaturase (delta-12 desaturase)